MIGNIETVNIQIDADTFQLTKLYAKDGYDLYLRCLGVLAPILNAVFKNKNTTGDVVKKITSELNLHIEQMINAISEKFCFSEVIQLLKASNIKRNYKEINDSEWNVTSPILIMELFSHVIKINVASELAKKDLGQIIGRLFGSKILQKA